MSMFDRDSDEEETNKKTSSSSLKKGGKVIFTGKSKQKNMKKRQEEGMEEKAKIEEQEAVVSSPSAPVPSVDVNNVDAISSVYLFDETYDEEVLQAKKAKIREMTKKFNNNVAEGDEAEEGNKSQFQSEIQKAVLQREQDRAEIQQTKMKREREEEKGNADLMEKDREMGQFMTPSYQQRLKLMSSLGNNDGLSLAEGNSAADGLATTDPKKREFIDRYVPSPPPSENQQEGKEIEKQTLIRRTTATETEINRMNYKDDDGGKEGEEKQDPQIPFEGAQIQQEEEGGNLQMHLREQKLVKARQRGQQMTETFLMQCQERFEIVAKGRRERIAQL